jgi:hypothetical protein
VETIFESPSNANVTKNIENFSLKIKFFVFLS